MTPEQALAIAAREPWSDVVICGFHEGTDALVVRSSHMTREQLLWLTEHLKLHALDRL